MHRPAAATIVLLLPIANIRDLIRIDARERRQFEVYDIAGNTLIGAASLGTVGLDWQLGGLAVDPPEGAMGAATGSASQLVQARASFGGTSSPVDGFNTAASGAEMSQQPLLTIPQHA